MCRILPIVRSLIFFVGLLTFTVVNAQVNAEQVMNIGRNVLSMDDYMLAIQYFNQAIKAKPYMSEPYYLRALAKLNLEDYKGAEEDCSLSIERNEYRTEAYKLRGFARQYMGKDSLAITDYDFGLKYYPQDKYFLFYKGVAQTGMEDYEGADTTFNKLLRFYPSFEDAYSARGRLKVLRGDTIGALEDISRSISISPNEVNPYLQRAEIESKRGHWEQAVADMDAAIRLRPDETDYYINRAYLRYNSDDFFGAMSDYNYALQLDPTNSSAMFNRALLRYEVRDLNRAEADFTSVLKLDPNNFHALFNRGLVNLDRGDNKGALRDFKTIASRYPRYYPAYYAMAEAYRNMGDMRTAMQNVYHAEELIRKYVKNPKGNPLDRPKIAYQTSNDRQQLITDDESEIEVMEKFNQLVTVSKSAETEMSFNEKIKGRVQDRNVDVAPERIYGISFVAPKVSLKSMSNYFRELDDFNQRHYIPEKIYLSSDGNVNDEEAIARLFSLSTNYEQTVETRPTAANQLALGVLKTLLRDYAGAMEMLDKAVEGDPSLTPAYMARAYAGYKRLEAESHSAMESDEKEDAVLQRNVRNRELVKVITDYDMALHLNPRLVYAWFNKGSIYYEMQDYTSAISALGNAIELNPDFGEAYFNRGLAYLRMGNRQQAFSDLSRAGELGVVGAYSLLKRMK